MWKTPLETFWRLFTAKYIDNLPYLTYEFDICANIKYITTSVMPQPSPMTSVTPQPPPTTSVTLQPSPTPSVIPSQPYTTHVLPPPWPPPRYYPSSLREKREWPPPIPTLYTPDLLSFLQTCEKKGCYIMYMHTSIYVRISLYIYIYILYSYNGLFRTASIMERSISI